MLTNLGQRNHEVRENPDRYVDYDNDNDNDVKRYSLMDLFNFASSRFS